MRFVHSCSVIVALLALAADGFCADVIDWTRTPMRPLPQAFDRPLGQGPAFYVDSAKGDDNAAGTKDAPWKTIARGMKNLKPGDTLVLRGGVYREGINWTVSGAPNAPVTLRAHQNELVVVDGGIAEFLESSEKAWEPVEGTPGEFRSVKPYPDAAGKKIHGVGNFADSMVPMHPYRTRTDLVAENQFWIVKEKTDQEVGIYCGPGMWWDIEGDKRVHIRLAHLNLQALGSDNYMSETDPRKVRIIVSGMDNLLNLSKVEHVRVQDIVFRGSRGSAILMADAKNIELDSITVYAGVMGLRMERCTDTTIRDSAFRGTSAPWSFRNHQKYRGIDSYLFNTSERYNAPATNERIDLLFCEFTDHHDALRLEGAKNIRVRQCAIDNFNDDGIDFGPKQKESLFEVSQNMIGRCFQAFTLHGDANGPGPEFASDPGTGAYIGRNVIDLRAPVLARLENVDSQKTTYGRGAQDHASPLWPNYFVYHNTIILRELVWRDTYGAGFAHGLKASQRRIFNNIFVHMTELPGATFTSGEDDLIADYNLLWSPKAGPEYKGDYTTQSKKAKSARNDWFTASKKKYADGWTAHDLFADPKLNSLPEDWQQPINASLQEGSPAIDHGMALPAEWPDALRTADKGLPDIGALPAGAPAWGVGVRGRYPITQVRSAQ